MQEAQKCTVQLAVVNSKHQVVAVGSGAVVSQDGIIVTAAHLVTRCTEGSTMLVGVMLEDISEWRYLADVVTYSQHAAFHTYRRFTASLIQVTPTELLERRFPGMQVWKIKHELNRNPTHNHNFYPE